MLGRFNDWLTNRGGRTELFVAPEAFEGFRDYLQAQGKLRAGYECVLRHVFKMMHPELGVDTPSAVEVLLREYRECQLNERGLARTSVIDSRRMVRSFLEHEVPNGANGDFSHIRPDLIAGLNKAPSRPCIYRVRKACRYRLEVLFHMPSTVA
jgi:hypothetical protein